MARMVKGLMSFALLGAMVMPASGYAVQVNSPAPTSSFNLQSMLGQQLQGQAALNGLAMANGLNLGNMEMADFGKALAMSMVQSALSGNFDPQSMFGNMANMMMVGAMGGLQQQLGLGNMAGGGMGGMGGAMGNFGGLGGNMGSFGLFGGAAGGGLQQAMLGSILQSAVSQLIGGIQGGGGGGGDNFGGMQVASLPSTPNITQTGTGSGYIYDPMTGNYVPANNNTNNVANYVATDDPIISRTAEVVETSLNYISGYYDAMDGLTPDSRFQFVNDGAYDTNYWAGYQKGLSATKKV